MIAARAISLLVISACCCSLTLNSLDESDISFAANCHSDIASGEKIMAGRSVSRIVHSEHYLEGAGFPVARYRVFHPRVRRSGSSTSPTYLFVVRPIGGRQLDHFDPFLLLDHFGPVTWKPGEAVRPHSKSLRHCFFFFFFFFIFYICYRSVPRGTHTEASRRSRTSCRASFSTRTRWATKVLSPTVHISMPWICLSLSLLWCVYA
jgi:hypothetical protein